MANLTNHYKSPCFINAVFYHLDVLIVCQSIGFHVTMLTLLMTMGCTAEPQAATADCCPQDHRATNLMNVRSSCLSELFSEHPLLQHTRALHSTAALECHKRLQTATPKCCPRGHRLSLVPHTPPPCPGPRGLQVLTTTQPILAHRHSNRSLSHHPF